jgi:hypothetical protein
MASSKLVVSNNLTTGTSTNLAVIVEEIITRATASVGENSVSQDNITAGGDVAGRDVIKPIFNINTGPLYHEDTVLKRLLAEHEQEKKTDLAYRAFSEELNRFFSKALTNNLRDLETKLIDGNREYLIIAALDSKERLAKKIHKYGLYKSAQEIYTYLLVNIRTSFLHQIQSKIKSKEFSQYQIDEIVCSQIIDPFLHNLQGSSLEIDKDELYGILYFLTGNCYIEWD